MAETAHRHDMTAAWMRGKVYSLLADGFSQVDGNLFEVFKSGYIPTWGEVAGSIEGGEVFLPCIEKLEKVLSINFSIELCPPPRSLK